ncbi:MAG: helix-turn-helix domain-containing protein [Ferrovum myxofaciens]|uniref:Helix-turn-helix domain-containing protein n=1 Tax=Ferrovum myxofaciens TaxID=416213 RepID=A0A9E6SYW8_9PROT|nr:helix-turn-helix domain-containing protein [Ferrovum myxofaciens]MBW8028526.1 helix-turn-helix domain-containing protein [Ferrovum sp.]QKE39741.1 MAG: helix-turn-helix domain-containing protein [Ferrovum myxofaciens]QWY76159.1 MAG: helix-turn-helix domain-containing protein [Ferrovum myxofaciens]QWY78819.1 MAG: helix-turn-helix domain-containing protein [Ferrovum myxofaciens]
MGVARFTYNWALAEWQRQNCRSVRTVHESVVLDRIVLGFVSVFVVQSDDPQVSYLRQSIHLMTWRIAENWMPKDSKG